MARDFSIYLNASTSNPDGDLDSSDDRYLEIIELFDKRKFKQVGDKAEELALAGVLDVRPLSYALFVAFYEDGLVALATIFDVVVAAFGPQRKMIGPQSNQAAQFAKRFTWLWATANDNLAYYRKEKGADWQRLCQGLTPEVMADILERGKQVAIALSDVSQEKTATALASFVGELRTLAKEIEASAQAAARAAAEAESAPNEDEDEAIGENEFASEAHTAEGEESEAEQPTLVVVKGSRAGKKTVTLEVSPAFLELMHKLKAFETLVEQGRLEKAAIVADDIQSIIEAFDPRVHFPGLLSRFSELLSVNSESLGELLENRDSFTWKTMAQFYKVDVDKFVHGESNARPRRR